MDLVGYVKALRKSWWIVAAMLALGLGIGGALVLTTEPKYATTIRFFVNTPSDTIAGSFQGDTFGQKRVNTYVQLIKTDRLGRLVADDLKNGMSSRDITDEIAAEGDLNTVILTATVTDSSPERSLAVATSVSVQFVSLVASLETADASIAPTVKLEVVDGPTLNPTPVEPKLLVLLGFGALLGLLTGIGLAVLKEVLDTSVRTSDDLQSAAGSPVMAVIPFDAVAKSSPVLIGDQLKTVRAEAYRQLRTNLQFVGAAGQIKVLVVTSSVSGEGKSSTSANLALTFADAGARVLLIEGDLRRPRIADYFGMEGSVGLTNVLAGQVNIGEVVQRLGNTNVTLLPSGSIPPNPSEMLGSPSMITLVTALREDFDTIIIDTPPLLPVTDAAIVSTYADGVLIVAKYGQATRAQVAASARALGAVDARLVGSVLSMAPTKGVDAYDYSYGYEDEPGGRDKLVIRPVKPAGPVVPLSDPSANGSDRERMSSNR